MSSDVTNLFSIACKDNFKNMRQSLRTIQAYKSKEKKKSRIFRLYNRI